MVLLPGSSISTEEAKAIEAEKINREENDSIRGSPPPPYRFPFITETVANQVLTPNYSLVDQHSIMGYQELPTTNVETNSSTDSSESRGCRRFGRGRGRCHRRNFGNLEGDRRGGECFKKHKRKHLFRKVLMRFTVFFILSMIWIHHDSIAQSLGKALDALPQPIMNSFSIIGHILYLPISFSQTIGIAFYCAIGSLLITILHLKLRRRRMARWRNDLHTAIRARILNGQPEHDHEAWPGQTSHFNHHHNHMQPQHFHHHHHHHQHESSNVNAELSSDEYEKSSTSSSI